MVFFNYSTMQMAAKVVYYGPGLCGKTTNLHYIYQHTVGESRGEMVSLETETDRTLFFDLLPIDVGSIAGFNTRIQLYTVPGQVFYNTTRKLVLKGVDGVVFVADSQRAMLQTNVESFRNLEENLTEMGLAVDTLPLVLQFNKRDLTDICSPDEMNAALNRHNWPFFEASAVSGMGVFETLKGISRFTLMSLKKRLGRSEPAPRPAAAPVAGAPRPAAPPPLAGAPATAPAPPAAPRPAAPPPSPMSGSHPQMPPLQPPAQAPAPPAASRPVAAAPPAPPPGTPLAPARPAPPAVAAPPKAPPGATRGRTMDVLGELEKLRREAASAPPRPTQTGPRPTVAPSAPAAASLAGGNGRGELSRSIELTLRRADFLRARRVLVSFQVEDDQHRVMDAVRDLAVDIKDAAGLEKLLLRLNIALNAKE
jgi:mutual gliding-motility protein MglA